MKALGSAGYIVGILGLVSTPARSAPPVRALLECPPQLVVEQRQVQPQAGWQEFYEKLPHVLSSVAFYDGPPEELASLVPDRVQGDRGEQRATWRFAADAPRGYYLICVYTNTTARLMRRLPRELTNCTVTYVSSRVKQSSTGAPKRIECSGPESG